MKPPIPTRQQQLEAILEESQRPGRVPIRNAFVQQRHGTIAGPGPLSEIVRRGRHSALDQYMITLGWASGGDHDVRRHAKIWARAIGVQTDEAGRRTVSRNWRLLQDLQLIEVRRVRRLASVQLLREDGSGEPYNHPSQSGAKYFQVPFMFWTDEWVERLSLPGKAMLLVSMSLPDFFRLPADRGPAWYGLSESTVERGLRELRRADLLQAWRAPKLAPLTPSGYTVENFYRLRFPFGPRGRVAGGVPAEILEYADLPESSTSSPTLQSGKSDAKGSEQPSKLQRS